MIREICDVCKKNDADEKYCFQKSTRIKQQNTSRGIDFFVYQIGRLMKRS